MTDPRPRLYQEEINARAADLRAVAAELELDVQEAVARSRALRFETRRLRSKRRRSPPERSGSGGPE